MSATFWPYNYQPTGPRGQHSSNKERAHQHAHLEADPHAHSARSSNKVNQGDM